MSACLLACLSLVVHAGDAKVKWETDLKAASKLAKKLDRPMFVVFRCEH
jgi:hypothetical protein